MAYNRITWLPDVLRDVGIEVVLYPGWRTRGLSTSQRFEPSHVVWHHDASPFGDSPGVPQSMINRYTVAGAQVWIDRSGRWHIIASGRAAHAGTVKAGMPDNYDSIGIETDHTTGEGWPPALLESLRIGTAAIFRHMRTNADRGLHFHKTICYPTGRKVDPDGLTLTVERRRVAALMSAPADDRPAVSIARLKRAARRAPWAFGRGGKAMRRDRRRVRKALKAEGVRTYRGWQKKLGYRGADADGLPGRASLTTLGNRHGFRVVA